MGENRREHAGHACWPTWWWEPGAGLQRIQILLASLRWGTVPYRLGGGRCRFAGAWLGYPVRHRVRISDRHFASWWWRVLLPDVGGRSLACTDWCARTAPWGFGRTPLILPGCGVGFAAIGGLADGMAGVCGRT